MAPKTRVRNAKKQQPDFKHRAYFTNYPNAIRFERMLFARGVPFVGMSIGLNKRGVKISW